jgi:hypothetical protein
MLKQAAFMLILLNGFNLLPVLPLDGGHFLHSTLFCRNRWLDIAFRTLAVVALLGLSVYGMGKAMMYIGIVLAIALPIAFKMGKLTDRFRREPLPIPLPGEDRIPIETAKALITAVKSELPKSASNKVLAQHALNIFETLNARPPNAWVTIGLLALYGGGFLASLVFGMLLVISKEGRLGDFVRSSISQPRYEVACNSTQSWQKESSDSASRNLIITTFKKPAAAQNAFAELTSRLPSTANATLFGNSLIVGLPADDEKSREEWFEKLQQRSTNLFVVVSNNAVTVSLAFLAPTAEVAKEIEQDLGRYFFANSAVEVIPPWEPAYKEPAFAKQREARRVWQEINRSLQTHWSNTNLTSYEAKIASARRRGANREAERLGKEQQQRAKELQEQMRQGLQKKYAGTIFASLINLESELARIPYTNRKERAAVTSKLALELGGRERPPHATFGFGSVDRNGLLLEIAYLSIRRPESSLPQLLNWLCDQHSTQIRYTFQNFGGDFGDDDEE